MLPIIDFNGVNNNTHSVYFSEPDFDRNRSVCEDGTETKNIMKENMMRGEENEQRTKNKRATSNTHVGFTCLHHITHTCCIQKESMNTAYFIKPIDIHFIR